MLRKAIASYEGRPDLNRFRFQCDLCSGSDWTGDDPTTVQGCPKCGRPPVRYFDGDLAYCCLHGEPMEEHYTFPAEAILNLYSWSGHCSAFPNARLFPESLPSGVTTGKDCFTLAICRKCEAEYQRWRQTPRE